MKALRNLAAAAGIAGASFAAGTALDSVGRSPAPLAICPPAWTESARSTEPAIADATEPPRSFVVCETDFAITTPHGTILARTSVTLYDGGGYVSSTPDGGSLPRALFEASR